jgi:two-component system, chemotaxis family, CheB/CheR fusion protein
MSPPDSHRPDSEQPGASPSNESPGHEPAGEFFVVGIAASAGGLEAISELLKRIPPRTNLAIALVQHLDPNHASMLVELLGRVTSIPVHWAAQDAVIEANHVYVAPPRMCLSVKQGKLCLHEQHQARHAGDADHLLHSLAEEYKHRAVAIILSGNGADGTEGAKSIKGMGGIVMAQDPAQAAFPSMPRSAIDSGYVDRVLTPVGIAEELVKLTHTAPVLWSRIAVVDEAPPSRTEAEQLQAIFRLLAVRTGVDFSDYKQSMIKRRLARQMMLAKVPELADYVRLLQKNRDEVDKLNESLLINVTEFFRDPEYFDFLRASVLPEIMNHRDENTPIRIWVPGCSTGEEAYSYGILIRELLDEKGEMVQVQIFGTDVSDRAIGIARAGHFSPADVTNVTPDRLKRFFYKTDRGYVVQKPIRDMCVFARQNVAKDSPFSRIDLISCRNLLIYLSAKLQRKVMPIFHYALNADGYLVLGNSESVGSHVELYRLIDRRFRIYSRKSTNRRANFEFSVEHPLPGAVSSPRPTPAMPDELKEPFDIIREADRIVLNRHGPIGVLVNEDLDILQFRGDVSLYLAPVPGRASLNLIKMAREGISAELQSALQEAREKNTRVQRTGISMMQGDVAKPIDIDVTPIDTIHTKERFYLVFFSPAATPAAATGTTKPDKAKKQSTHQTHIDQLRQDLQATRNYLQATIEKHEATNQELRAANEEIQSSNEELQSTNEELETAKEELQSTNEELTTVNEELHSRQVELIQVNNDLNNLINSVHLPIIILGQDMRIRRFTPMAEKVLNVIPTDIGRPLSDININLKIANLPRLMSEVMDSLTLKELEVQDNHGRWYSMRLRPYKTAENKIQGVVLTLIDIDQMKRTIVQVEEARDFAQAVIESVPEPLAVLTPEFRIRSANEAFTQLFRTSLDSIQDRSFFDLARDHDGIRQVRNLLEGLLPNGGSLTNHEARLDLPIIGPTPLLITGRQIVAGSRSYPLIVLSLRRKGDSR